MMYTGIFKSKLLTMALLAFSILPSCEEKQQLAKLEDEMQLSYGKSSQIWANYKPFANRPIKVWTYIPKSAELKTMPVLFAMHGADRNAEYQIDSWKDVAEDRGVAIIAPDFDRAQYPPVDYQFGGVSLSESHYQPRDSELYTYCVIEELFDWFKEMTGNTTQTYDLWGHSAGGQFVHRMLLFMPSARVNRAISSNSGFYTVPDMDGIKSAEGRLFDWPYSLRYTFTDNSGKKIVASASNLDGLRNYFSRDLTIHLGTSDLASSKEEDSSFPTQAGAMAQGATRYERGHFFFDYSKRIADELGVSFNWKIAEVKDVGHNSRAMVQKGDNSAACLLYYTK